MKKRSDAPAQHAKILLEIERRFGVVTPKIVVDLAKDPNHPLHSQFEWRDDVAAQKFREDQARELIRSARLNITVHEVSIEAYGFVHDPTIEGNKQGYRSVLSLQGDRISSVEALAVEIRQAAALLRRARDVGVSLGLDVSVIHDLWTSADRLASSLVTVDAAASDAA